MLTKHVAYALYITDLSQSDQSPFLFKPSQPESIWPK